MSCSVLFLTIAWRVNVGKFGGPYSAQFFYIYIIVLEFPPPNLGMSVVELFIWQQYDEITT